MKRSALLLALVILACGPHSTRAATIIGDLNNFDTLNDTGQVCYGFEIELDDVVSTEITYTFDWNHYGAPKIRQDDTVQGHPKVFIRYESTRDANGNLGANGSLTNTADPTMTPPQGHTCTDISVNQGCEHFGVGYYRTPTAIKYNWLVDGGGGNLVYFGSPVAVAAPKFAYTPPAAGNPAQVVAAIPAPAVPVAGKEFGEPSWVKVIKTTTHNANPIPLRDLISDDADNDGKADWQNKEPDEVESEWFLLQTHNGANPKAELEGAPDDMGDGSEIVTRRYEFYRYGAAADTIDGENGEAMCDEVDPNSDPTNPLTWFGVGTAVEVADAGGGSHTVDCAAQIVVGTYIGAQMAGFAAEVPLGLIDHLQDGEAGTDYTPRTVVVGGNTPFSITIANGSLPQGLAFDSDGVLSGKPTASGDFSFTVQVTDSDPLSASQSQSYSLHVAAPVVPPTPPTVLGYKVLFGTQNYTVPGGRIRLPWTTITGIQVTFSAPVIGNASSLTGVAVTGISGSGTDTLTWTFAPLAVATYNTKVLGTTANAVVDTAGTPLGGGVDFVQALSVLPGDRSDDGFVASNDMVLVNLGRSTPYNILNDINGDGIVDINDVSAVRARIGKHLP